MRADLFLYERGFFKSRSKASAALRQGDVFIEGKAAKPSDDIADGAKVEIQALNAFVSKGGEKLEKAFRNLGLNVSGLICADIGASSGGFTDCLLRRGAKKVYAVDVGENQLDQSLREDARVVIMDNTNARNLTPANFTEDIDFICADLSFISLRHVLGVFASLLNKGKTLAALIKPQFEAGRGKVGKSGIVREEKIRQNAVESIKSFAEGCGFRFSGIVHTDADRGKNIEYVAVFIKD